MTGKKKQPRPGAKAKAKPKPKPKTNAKAQQQSSQATQERKPSREERWEAARRAKRRRSTAKRAVAAVVALAVVGGLVAWQVGKRRDESRAIAAMEAGPCDFDRRSDPGRVNQHADSVAFKVEPPSGGVHEPSAASPGVFEGGRAAPPDGQIVHAMEHGDIVLWYRPGLPEKDVDALRDLAESRSDDVFLVERRALPSAVAATAWHKRLLCEAQDLRAFRRFVDRYADKGPESPPE